MQWITLALGVIKAFFGWQTEKERSGQLEQARQGGAAEAAKKGSDQVDAKVDEARQAVENLDRSDEAIENDPYNRDNQS